MRRGSQSTSLQPGESRAKEENLRKVFSFLSVDYYGVPYYQLLSHQSRYSFVLESRFIKIKYR